MSIQATAVTFDVVKGTTLAGRTVTATINGVDAGVVSAVYAMGSLYSVNCDVTAGVITIPAIDASVTALWPVAQIPWDLKVRLTGGFYRTWVYGLINVLKTNQQL